MYFRLIAINFYLSPGNQSSTTADAAMATMVLFIVRTILNPLCIVHLICNLDAKKQVKSFLQEFQLFRFSEEFLERVKSL